MTENIATTQQNLKNDKLDNDHPAPQQQEKVETTQPAGFLSLFRFATNFDYFIMIVGTIASAAMGVALPAFAILWGSITNEFGNAGQLEQAAKNLMLQFIYIGLGALAAGWLMFMCWMIAGERQSIACRKEYLKSLLKQQIGWFDTINQSELATSFATDCFAFKGAIGEKVSSVIMSISMFIAGFIIAFFYGWLMTLVVLASLPVIAFGGILYAGAIGKQNQEQEKDYSEAGGLVEQAVEGIKTVKQLNGEQFESSIYQRTLTKVKESAVKYGVLTGVGLGALFFAMLASYSLGFWFGSHCVEGSQRCPPRLNGGEKYSAGDVLIVFFSILMAGFNFTQLTPAIKKISEGRIAAARIFKIVDRKPLIASSPNAIVPKQFKGHFKFENVTFAYPKDKSKNILENLNMEINVKNAAFVGESGCGKSTVFQLLMRFYDPDRGSITLDGVDLRDLDLYWLRGQIGYVGQEPVLFATTIKQNLLYGKEDATDEQIESALKQAEALDFITKLKDKLETYVGTGGGQMSGGQKQRIAIARALLKKPKLLLLDEATSALDRRNEKLIQSTLNQIAEGTSTINIAHRVKTIMDCDKIFVFEKGGIQEQGQFKDLQRFKNLKMTDENVDEELMKNEKKEEQIVLKKGESTVDGENRQGEQLDEDDKKKKKEEQILKKYEDSIFSRLFAYVSDQKLLFVIGILCAVANGLIFPFFSIFLSKMLAVLVEFGNNPVAARSDANNYALYFLLFGIGAFILNVIVQTIFSVIGQELTEKIRNQTYEKILKMPIPWFDKTDNASGSLSARLASDCRSVNSLITTFIAITIQSLSTLIAGATIAYIYEWRTSLVATGLLPLMIIAGVIQMAFTQGFSDQTDKVFKNSSSIITESMNNIRTVTSFGSEDIIERKYQKKLEEPLQIGNKKGIISGALFGVSQFILFLVFGLIFYLGIIFMNRNGLQVADVFTAIYAIVFSGMTAGNNAHFMPDMASGKQAAASLFQIQDSKDEDQLQIEAKSKMLKDPIKGHIIFKDVSFKYESRDFKVFKKLNLQIKEGQKVGFVGPSGCGKSTVQQLIQRFYDPDEGQIILDGHNIQQYDIHHLRGSLGVVSQQPVLFNNTIGWNIQYNRDGTTHEEIVAAANQSNFNPEFEAVDDPRLTQTQKQQNDKNKGFNKNVGVRGSHISGGQKQRVAIARAILRRPKVLLLDEATSALDSANEKKVQESLDKMMKGRTAITVAHRLDTIKNSDQIMVFHHGKIVQSGNYQELLERKGYFYSLEKGLQIL